MWIDVSERVPPIGTKVSVRGKFTPADVPYPEAIYDGILINGLSGWNSKESRGTVGVTHWWESSLFTEEYQNNGKSNENKNGN